MKSTHQLNKKNIISTRSKLMSAIVLLVVAVVAMTALSYAWFQNHIDIIGLGVKTGKMLYDFEGYHLANADNSQSVVQDFSYSTNNSTNGTTSSASVDLEAIQTASGISTFVPVDSNNVGQVLFVVKRHEKSIDFDAVLNFTFDRLVVDINGSDGKAIDYTNSIWYNVYDESAIFASYMSGETATVEGYLNTYPLNEGQSNYIEGSSELLTDLDGRSFSRELTLDSDYMLIRVVYGWSADAMGQMQTNVEIPIRVDLNISQNGMLGDGEDGETKTIPVRTAQELRRALDTFMPRDEIQILEDFTYVGDITIARPVNIVLLADLTIQGNLTYLYMERNTFNLNTSGGTLTIKNSNGLGGNFVIDTPQSSFNILGQNNSENGSADIYIENEFRVTTTTRTTVVAGEDNYADKENGLLLNNCRICQYDEDLEEDALKQITLNGNARVYVASRTTVGPIIATLKCRWVKILNQGTIEKLDLSDMDRDITLKESEPAIHIDSRGNWSGDETIILPGWSMKFYTPGKPDASYTTYRGNTTIISNYGSGNMKAYVIGCKVGVKGYGIKNGEGIDAKLFFDDYELVEENTIPNLKTDIDRKNRLIFVEKLKDKNGKADPKKIKVYYEVPNPEIFTLNGYDFKAGEFGNTLESVISHYLTTARTEDRISQIEELTYLEIICFGNKNLTEDDYKYIRTMSSLVEINLSEAVSKDYLLPTGALSGLTNLTKAMLSNYDTAWNPEILMNTGVNEIWLPASLKKLNNTIESAVIDKKQSTYNTNNVIGNIRIVHTSTTVITGFEESTTVQNYNDAIFYEDDDSDIYKVKQFFFVPDEATLQSYRQKYGNGNNNAWNRCIFIDGEIYGDYVVRIVDNKNNVCEFVTYIGDNVFDATAAAQSEYAFDFKNITLKTINELGQEQIAQYKIKSYDDYAFCNRIASSTAITFSDKLSKLGDYSFATAKNPSKTDTGYSNNNQITSVAFNKNGVNVTLEDYVFFNVTALTTVEATTVTSAGAGCFWKCTSLKTACLERLEAVNGQNMFVECTSLEKLDLGIIEKTDSNNSNFISGNSKIIIEIHSNGQTVPFESALAENIGRIFVQDNYVYLYEAYITRVAELGTHTMATILRADKYGKVLPNDAPQEDIVYYFFPVLNENGEQTNNTVLSVYMGDQIIGNGKDYKIIDKFVDEQSGKSYVVTRIGRAAFRLTQMGNIDTLIIPEGVTEIGHGAFASDAYEKHCVTLQLNNTTLAEAEAFYKMGAVKIYGDELVEVGPKSLSGLTKLIVACFPKLDKLTGVYTGASYPAENTIFSGCTNLHVAYVGPSTQARYCKSGGNDYSDSPGKLTMFFINGNGNVNSILDKNSFKYLHAFVSDSTASLYGDRVTSVGQDFNKLILASWYTITGISGTSTLGGTVSYSIILPGYAFYKSTETTLNQLATADEVSLLPGIEDYSSKYTTPEALYDTGETIKKYGSNETMIKYLATDYLADNPAFTVTDISSSAYSFVDFSTSYFKFGSFLKTYNASPRSAGIKSVKTLDMSNIERIDGNAGLGTFSGISTLIANNVTYIHNQRFNGFNNIKTLYLPKFNNTDQYPFNNCSGIEDVILGGENFVKDKTNYFLNCGGLKRIYILSDEIIQVKKSTAGAYWGTAAAEKNLVFYVRSSMLSEVNGELVYSDGTISFTTNYYNTPLTNFKTFDEVSTIGSVSFFWEKISDTEAKITSAIGTLPEDLVIPTTVTSSVTGITYNVASVSKDVFLSTTSVKTVTLPANLKYIDFNPSDLPETLSAFVIDESNPKFITVNGVLYSKNTEGDPIALLIFPQGNNSFGETFDLPKTVTSIADEAFYGVKYLNRINITNPVIVGSRVFANSLDLTNITFKSETPSIFVGRDTFLNADQGLFIYVPSNCISAYKANVWLDNFVRIKYQEGVDVFEDMFRTHSLNEVGYCINAECVEPDAMIEQWMFDEDGTSSMMFSESEEYNYYMIHTDTDIVLTITQNVSGISNDSFSNDYISMRTEALGSNTGVENGTKAEITLSAGQTLYFVVKPIITHNLKIIKSIPQAVEQGN